MLFWESLNPRRRAVPQPVVPRPATVLRSARLPFDKRCGAITKHGKRCRGKIRPGTDFCPFHNPDMSDDQRRQNAAKGGRSKRRLAHIPGGYLARLTDRRSVGHAMDRLYREIRVGLLTPEMGKVLFDVLCRLLEESEANGLGISRRTKARRMRPKISELLTQSELFAWRTAVASAPASFVRMSDEERMRVAAQSEQLRLQNIPSRKPKPAAAS